MTGEYVKSVTFDKMAHVVLIPVVQEYKDAKIDKDVWYNSYEMLRLRKEYITELKTNCIKTKPTN